MNNEFVVDFQAFKGYNNKYIIKELTILPINGLPEKHVLLKPPFAFYKLSKDLQRQVVWLENHYHKIYWNSGTTPYGDLIKIFSDSNIKGRILAVDETKTQCLESFLGPFFDVEIINLQDYGCPSLKMLKTEKSLDTIEACPFKHKSLNCSHVNANLLLQWWLRSGAPSSL